MNKEYVLVLFKPDVMAKGLVGHILSRFAETDLEVIVIKAVCVSRALAEDHYYHLKDQPFYDGIIKYLQGKLHGGQKVIALVYGGKNAISLCRKIAGATNPEEADPKTIRGSLGRITTKGVFENLVHVSSDKKEAAREIKLWFSPDEIGTDIFPTKNQEVKSFKRKVWK